MSPLSFFCVFSASSTITFFYFLESWAINKQVGTTNILFCLIKVSRLASQLSTLSFLYLSLLLFLVSSFFYILPTISDLLCTLAPPPFPALCLFAPSAPLHSGKWLYPVEWLCKDAETGFKLSPAKGRDRRRKIKKRGTEKRFIRVLLSRLQMPLPYAKRWLIALLYIWTSGKPNTTAV